jgi:hypothetical protein
LHHQAQAPLIASGGFGACAQNDEVAIGFGEHILSQQRRAAHQ